MFAKEWSLQKFKKNLMNNLESKKYDKKQIVILEIKSMHLQVDVTMQHGINPDTLKKCVGQYLQISQK